MHLQTLLSLRLESARPRRLAVAIAAAIPLLLAPSGGHAVWTFGNNTSTTSKFSMSGNGRYVAFLSTASNLVPSDTNGVRDVFRLDLQTGELILVSVDSNEIQATANALVPSISFDGAKVAWHSSATNLVAGDTNASNDVFVRDIPAGTTVRASLVNSTGAEATGGFGSSNACISSNGNRVVFESSATNLVSGDTNGFGDIFVRDLAAGTTVRVNVDNNGNQPTGTGGTATASINSDGTKVTFNSTFDNLVTGDTNGGNDVFVRDLTAGTTVRVSVDSNENQVTAGSANAMISSDGTKVVFSSSATTLVSGDNNATSDIFLRDLVAGTTIRVSVNSDENEATGGQSSNPAINSNGTKVAFDTAATNLAPNDTNGFNDIFVRDLTAGTTVRASVSSSGAQATGGHSFTPSLNSDGTKVSFYSGATNLVPNDTNGTITDQFIRDLTAGATMVPVTLSGFEID